MNEVHTRLTCVVKTWSWPRIGCASRILTAAFPTNQSPPNISRGDPFNEYGWAVAPMIGKRERNTRPAPRAPLEAQSDSSEFLKYKPYSPMKILGIR